MNKSIFCTLLILLFALQSMAGSLTIVGEAKLKIVKQAHGWLLTGTYRMTNRGDEVAMSVYPEITHSQFFSFKWSGELVNLPPNDSHQWSIEQNIQTQEPPVAHLSQALFLFKNHYRDQQGYPFSSVAVEKLFFEKNDGHVGDDGLFITIEEINRERYGQVYTVKYKLKNNTTRDIKARVYAHLPSEFSMLNKDVPVDVKAQSELISRVQWDAGKALPGSQYSFFLYMDWSYQDRPQAKYTQWLNSSVKIQKPEDTIYLSADHIFLIAWICLAWLTGFVLWMFWCRPLKKFRLNQ